MQVNVDFHKTIGAVKRMHAVGQPPFSGGFLMLNFSHIQHLTNANIPYSRLHDVGGAFGGNRYVDIPNIFRDFDADETHPDSYDFAFTDELIKAMYQYGVKPIFRLGVTIENQAHIKAYRIHPPKDYHKWARICEHIVRHYNEGWANGFTFGIEYWEIWNEPENGVPGKNQMWTGTDEQYFALYDVTAKHLKACFGDTIKVGGYGACGFYGIYYHPEKYGMDIPQIEPDDRYDKDVHRVEFLYAFLEYITAHGSPMDFFSWHSYAKVEKTHIMDEFLHRVLTKYGYGNVERHLNEWNNAHDVTVHGKSYSSAAVSAMMCAMQHSHTDMLCYYDAKLTASTYGGFFAPLTYQPVCTYYAFKAFGMLYALGQETECVLDIKEDGVYAVAATDGVKKAVMIVNHSEEVKRCQTNIDGQFTVYLLDETHFLTPTQYTPTDFELQPHQVVLIRDYE